MCIDSVRRKLAGITIIGIKDARIDDVERLLSELARLGEFQLMDARLILGQEHVKFACYEALRAFEAGQNVTATLPMEMLVKAACTNQISAAISKLGVKKGSKDVVLVGVGADDATIEEAICLVGGVRSLAPLKPSAEKRRRVKRAFHLGDPVERTLLEGIALSALG